MVNKSKILSDLSKIAVDAMSTFSSLRKEIETLSPDIDMTFDFECPECGHEVPGQQIPMNVEFFWPRV